MDTHGGHQPLVDHGGNHLIGNGEIYNHATLRSLFPGYRWSTGPTTKSLCASPSTAEGRRFRFCGACSR
ncbi:hypothetical protein ACXIZN_16160 [Amycolatopsis sp. TRM77291]